MRHAGPDALDRLEDLLVVLRAISALKEKSRGVFYSGGRAFLHFHEDPAGLFADMRHGTGFERFEVTTKAQRRDFLVSLRDRLETGC